MKSSVKTIFRALLVVGLFLPVYYTFAVRPLDIMELNNDSHNSLNIHDNKSHTPENDSCNDTDLPSPDSTDIKYLTSSGWTFNAILDTNEDGIIDKKDVPLTYDLIENKGNGDGIIDDIEFNNWLSDAEYVGLARHNENKRILDVPGLVVTDKTVTSCGTEI